MLLIIKNDAEPFENVLYKPEDVIFAFELKKNGAYPNATESTKQAFDNLSRLNKDIKCVYLAFNERATYKHRVYEETLGHKVIELFSIPKGDFQYQMDSESQGKWKELISYLKSS